MIARGIPKDWVADKLPTGPPEGLPVAEAGEQAAAGDLGARAVIPSRQQCRILEQN